MKRTPLFLVLALLASCQYNHEKLPDPNVLKEADLAFSRMSLSKGLKTAFLFYAGSDVILLRNKAFPIKGKNAMKEHYEETKEEPVLTWEPEKAEIAASGEIGYTFGNWRMIARDSTTTDTFYGNYMTVWKKQADGSWKFVLDGGTSTPKPGSK